MNNKKSCVIILKRSVLYLSVVFLMLTITIFSKSSVNAAKDALKLCAENIIPSLFPFFVLSQFLVNTGFAHIFGKFLSPVMRPVFKVSGAGGIAFFIGIISGYPSGAKTISDLYRSGILQKEEAEILLPYCNNSGPLFIIGAVGLGMLKNIQAGIFLYIIHIISAITVGIIFRFISSSQTKRRANIKAAYNQNFGSAFSTSVKDSVSSILSVCGFVVFFSSVIAPFITHLENNLSSNILMGIAEVTGGISALANNYNLSISLPIISALLGFGGICVLLQVTGIVKAESLSVKHYIYGKLLQSILSFILCRTFLNKMLVVSTFSVNGAINFETGNLGAVITSIFIICTFYFSVLALRKNFKKD